MNPLNKEHLKFILKKKKKICNLLFDDDQYFTQWNTVVPTMSSAILNIQGAAAKEILEIELRYDKQQAIVNIQAAAAKGIQEEQLKQHPHQTSNKKQKI